MLYGCVCIAAAAAIFGGSRCRGLCCLKRCPSLPLRLVLPCVFPGLLARPLVAHFVSFSCRLGGHSLTQSFSPRRVACPSTASRPCSQPRPHPMHVAIARGSAWAGFPAPRGRGASWPCTRTERLRTGVQTRTRPASSQDACDTLQATVWMGPCEALVCRMAAVRGPLYQGCLGDCWCRCAFHLRLLVQQSHI